jgi:hypothetical protein
VLDTSFPRDYRKATPINSLEIAKSQLLSAAQALDFDLTPQRFRLGSEFLLVNELDWEVRTREFRCIASTVSSEPFLQVRCISCIEGSPVALQDVHIVGSQMDPSHFSRMLSLELFIFATGVARKHS